MTKVPRATRFALLAVLALACKDLGTVPVTLDFKGNSGLVYGTVTRQDGTPVELVLMPLGSHANCASAFGRYGNTRTDASGKYRAFATGTGLTHTACVRVFAFPGAAVALAADSAVVTLQLRTEGVLDSVKVDFVLKPLTP